MNKSIRSKLFISITFLLIFFIFVLRILNTLYLEKYYLNKKKNILIQNAKDLSEIYTGDANDIQNELDRTANITGSNIDIIDKNGKQVYSSFHRLLNEKNIKDNNFNPNAPPPPDQVDVSNKVKYIEGDYTFETRRDEQLKIDFLTLVTKLNNGDILAIRVPLLSISESVNIADNFILITGIVIVLLGSAWAYVFSKKFTKPILELNNIARKMAKFNFSEKCEIREKDEIGQLGRSINHLSGELNRAITELNTKNKRLEEDIEKERKIDEMRKEFISSVSHELRTPLAVIQGYAEGLISNVTESEEDRRFYCDVIINETYKMNKLVKDLLNLSQIESGYFQIEKTEFNITSLIEYVINKYKSIFAEKNIQVQFEPNESYIVCGDMVRIEQILTNYINNAINHIDNNKIINISEIIDDDKVKISVFNTGKHIPEVSKEKVWESFYKVDKARTRAYGGYGLGLSIVKAIQNLHNNAYGVKNVEGGVSFWFKVDKVDVN
ncbi:HAMP domain-containing sensor histidine kinase [Clostridium sp. CTA-5]